jgi:hypothetical protein
MENKKQLSAEQQKELISILKTRFEKNSSRHRGIAWAAVQMRLEADAEKLWSLSEMERTGANPMWLVLMKKPVDTCFSIVRLKVRKAAEVSVTTGQRLTREKNTNLKTALLKWLLPWELNF